MERDFNSGYNPGFMDYNMSPNTPPPGGIGMEDQIFNPLVQYEQAYCYYRYLCMQMDYKIKCKEYEKICDNRSPQDSRRDRKIE